MDYKLLHQRFVAHFSMQYYTFKIKFRRLEYMIAGEIRRKIQDKRLIQPLLESYIQQIFLNVNRSQVLDYIRYICFLGKTAFLLNSYRNILPSIPADLKNNLSPASIRSAGYCVFQFQPRWHFP
mgnify:CR=1 FL=1